MKILFLLYFTHPMRFHFTHAMENMLLNVSLGVGGLVLNPFGDLHDQLGRGALFHI